MPAVGSDVQHSGNLTVMAGPSAPRISPDGTRFAYWLSARSLVTCPIWDPHCSFHDTDYTLVSRVDRFTPPEEFGAVRDYRDPSWVGNDRLLVMNYGLGVKEGAISQVGAGEAGLLQWFDPPASLPYIGQGTLSRRGDKLATLAGTDAFGPAQEQLFLYGVSSGYPTPPEPKCYVATAAPPSGKFLIPSWSPDGTELAVGESDGIHIYGNIPDLRAPDASCAQITERILVHGSAPAWGPADVPGTGPPPPPPTPSLADQATHLSPDSGTTPGRPRGAHPLARADRRRDHPGAAIPAQQAEGLRHKARRQDRPAEPHGAPQPTRPRSPGPPPAAATDRPRDCHRPWHLPGNGEPQRHTAPLTGADRPTATRSLAG